MTLRTYARVSIMRAGILREIGYFLRVFLPFSQTAVSKFPFLKNKREKETFKIF